jgi:hypothetical protein
MTFPIMLCEPVRPQHRGEPWTWRFWCRFCLRYHHHSAAPGSRAAHCHNDASPYAAGYTLRLDPQYKKLNAECQRKERTRLQKQVAMTNTVRQ